MKNIITIQHTQSVHHINGMIGSWTNWDLTDLGKQQAENIGKNLAIFLGNQKYIMFSSDLKRARQTAEAVAKYLNIRPILTDVLRERNLGVAVGKSVQWAHENTTVWEKTVDDKAFAESESRRDVWNKLIPFHYELMNNQNENIILVSHGNTLSIFNAIWLGLNVEDLNRCDLFGSAGGVSILHENEYGKRIIRRMSDMSFIR